MDFFPSLGPPGRPTEEGQTRSPRGWVWRGAKLVLGAPLSAVPLGQIVRNGRQLGQILSDLRQGPKPSRAVPQQPDGRMDTATMTFVYGLSESELGQHLAQRRRQTAVTAYVAFGLGWVFLGAWLLRLLNLDWTGQRLLTALQFGPFCLMFFLTAFKHAHANWQMRTGLLGSAGDYLRSAEAFWPGF